MVEEFNQWDEMEDWLEGKEAPANWRKLTTTLDALYAQAPDEALLNAAKDRMLSSLEEIQTKTIYYGDLSETQIGKIWVASRENGILSIALSISEDDFVSSLNEKFGGVVIHSQEHVALALSQLKEYFMGKRRSFDLPIFLSHLTDFQQRVLQMTMSIPYGHVSTYGKIARQLGKVRSSRAVGQALAHNPVPIVIPCHRVLGADGSLHGYSGGRGTETKAQLLRLEGVEGIKG